MSLYCEPSHTHTHIYIDIYIDIYIYQYHHIDNFLDFSRGQRLRPVNRVVLSPFSD